jgi:plastocyanin
VHALATQLAPVLAVEKSKTPFYIVGGALVVWAFVLSMAIGMRRPNFPGSRRVERGVIAISATLVAATLAAAVLTSGGGTTTEAAVPKTAPTNTVTAPIAPKSEPESPAPTITAKAKAKAKAKAQGKSTKHLTPKSTSPPPPKTTTLALSVPGTALAYNTKTLTATAGSVAIALTNTSPLEHDVSIEQGGKVLGRTPVFTGGTKVLTLNLKPGTYKYFCSVPGHRQAGMEGTLTVK